MQESSDAVMGINSWVMDATICVRSKEAGNALEVMVPKGTNAKKFVEMALIRVNISVMMAMWIIHSAFLPITLMGKYFLINPFRCTSKTCTISPGFSCDFSTPL
jgi:hypothetical protein